MREFPDNDRFCTCVRFPSSAGIEPVKLFWFYHDLYGMIKDVNIEDYEAVMDALEHP